MDAWTLAIFLDELSPAMEVVDSFVFLDRKRLGREKLLSKIGEYSSTREAQNWLNMVPVDDFLSEVIDDWDVALTDVESLREVYERSWRSVVKSLGLRGEDVEVKVLRDVEVGDLIFRLEQVNF
ncbi:MULTISPECIES: hypothetical protein [unclassified Caulobacter]|uniref:hypothetical protein n=1 Tax=unclassified Caulobacter TaxID=2648921 RepID=UPI0011B6EB85|nr:MULTISPECIES: hypothetical protein [unclassified Caulobacter]